MQPAGAVCTVSMWSKFTHGTTWYLPLFWCMVVYNDVYETKEDTKGNNEPQSLPCNFLCTSLMIYMQSHGTKSTLLDGKLHPVTS